MTANHDNQHDSDSENAGHALPSPGFFARVRAYFLTGVLVSAPLVITFGLAWWFIEFVDSKVMPLIPGHYNPVYYLPEGYQEYGIPGFGLLVILIFITVVGWFTTNFAGRALIKLYERILARIPAVRSIYGAVKQILETVLANQSNAFRQAVLLEYPRRGMWAIGFITGETKGEVQNLTEDTVINIFLPTTPNPTSGFLLFVPRRDIVILDMTVEEAIKMVMSGGIVTPTDRRSAELQAKPRVSAKTYEDVDVLREKENIPVLVSKHPEPGNENTDDKSREDA
ncbi:MULTISPECIES: DUF502 domain-containing protein [Thalassospira]|jgi:uncharacterized membrane protein|uniref:DUF502 domain-containing protein n=3 Tax=Thalassospira TaxID=168934 RepID=A0ABR5XWB5_9PROT|nr:MULTISPECIES: DUF502 domain-containing protein [Thalassospira]MAL30935.1 DUF502 domain-containing protein [Thalassospira sp.]MBR9778964.1 DUF502 domain-containing protein [Rhodospirillales bacterium]AJD52063.1 hypothetical protein TH3_09735 [Thalassospira xiamenensis M-5 = DSM 17429]KEO50656.1 hypothetical protein SMB34_09950 [Thalassospira permensis NBRC 106175]KZC97036.1 hypothetical protein AUP40_03580 [Thalassospira xiamenensis]|tara:strand:- start:7861 stop:8709 length:849 start_codon:yes stop_codon:yes gene_type:complete